MPEQSQRACPTSWSLRGCSSKNVVCLSLPLPGHSFHKNPQPGSKRKKQKKIDSVLKIAPPWECAQNLCRVCVPFLCVIKSPQTNSNLKPKRIWVEDTELTPCQAQQGVSSTLLEENDKNRGTRGAGFIGTKMYLTAKNQQNN